MFSVAIIVASFLAMNVSASPANATSVEVMASVSAEQDGCLDHSVKELGMSAKRREGVREWIIGPQFLHPSISPEGSVEVHFAKGEAVSTIVSRAHWPGAPKEKAIQLEIEERLRTMTTKMAQICGVIRPELSCTVVSAPGANARPCDDHAGP